MTSSTPLLGRASSQSNERSIRSSYKRKGTTSPTSNLPKNINESLESKTFRRSRSSSVNSSLNPKAATKKETKADYLFHDYSALGKRIGKTLYYAGRLPSSPRPSFPLTVFAVNAFTNGTLGMELDTLEFLDLDVASEIGRNACVSPTVVMMALVYLDRLSKNNTAYLGTVKPSELFVVALLVASKFVQDDGEEYGFFYEDWGTPTAFDKHRLNHLEIKFLSALDWNLKVDVDEFYSTLADTERALALHEGRRRGWLTYTELHSLSHAFNWKSVWTVLLTYTIQGVTFACITYITLLATVATSITLTPEIIHYSRSILMPTDVSDLPLVNPLISLCQNEPMMTSFGNGSEFCDHSSYFWKEVFLNAFWCGSQENRDASITNHETKNQTLESEPFYFLLSHFTTRLTTTPATGTLFHTPKNHFLSLT